MIPSTVQQVVVLLAMLLPGTVYQAVVERLRGPRASLSQVESRVLRAIAVSAVLDAVYALVAGPWLVDLATAPGHGPVGAAAQEPRQVALAALLLVVVVPAAVAWGEAMATRKRSPARRDPAPTAWDWQFGRRTSCFVRVRTTDGAWIGGWYGSRSLASGYPHGHDVFLESQYMMRPDGVFGARVPGTSGVWVPAESIGHIEFLAPPDGARTGSGAGSDNGDAGDDGGSGNGSGGSPGGSPGGGGGTHGQAG